MQHLAMVRHRRIILLVEPGSAYGRGCLRGIARYARAHGGWVFFHDTRHLVEPPKLSELLGWHADGVIARIENPRITRIIRELRLPTIDIRGPRQTAGVSGVYTDDRKVIDMATEHLIANGLVHVAFCGYRGVDFSDSRQEAFSSAIADPRLTAHVFTPARRERVGVGSSYNQRGLEDSGELRRWLKKLPKPVGIIACNDTRAVQVLQACAAAGIRVPYDCSVVGVDNDDVLCQLSNPTLTSVAPNVEAVGFEAARLLDRALEGEAPPKDPLLIPPVGIEIRRSSDVMALRDPMLVEAVRLIRAQIGEGVNVKEILAELQISRSTFERQFREHLGCTPYEYILRSRVQRIRDLLVDTNYTLAKVAQMAGFRNVAHMTAVFRIRTGTTPGQYRRANT